MIIDIESLTKEFIVVEKTNLWKDIFFPDKKKIRAVDNVSFSINKGESVALLGPNGAGKTTTMKMLSGLIYPTSGKINVLGFKPFDRKREFLFKIGLVMGHKTGLDWDLTASQSFELIKRIYRIGNQDFDNRIKELTELLDVRKLLNIQVRRLSLGERMKMEVIGAILHNPEILFLDEPTIGLDIISRQRIRDFLRQIQQQYKVTLLLTSHDMDDVEKVCDRVMVINHGVKVSDSSLDSLMRKHTKDRYVKFIFKKLPEKEKLEDLGKIIEEGENFYTFKVAQSKMPELISKMADKYDLDDIDILSVPLEEIIADIYQKEN